jgi:hypothetical protein
VYLRSRKEIEISGNFSVGEVARPTEACRVFTPLRTYAWQSFFLTQSSKFQEQFKSNLEVPKFATKPVCSERRKKGSGKKKGEKKKRKKKKEKKESEV